MKIAIIDKLKISNANNNPEYSFLLLLLAIQFATKFPKLIIPINKKDIIISKEIVFRIPATIGFENKNIFWVSYLSRASLKYFLWTSN